MSKSSGFRTLLVQAGLLTASEVDALVAEAQRRKEPLWETLLRANKITESWLADTLARQLKMPIVALGAARINADVAHRIPETLARKYLCVPFACEKRLLKVAFVDPSNLETIQAIQFFTGTAVQPAVSLRSQVLEAIEKYYSRSQAIDIIDRAGSQLDVQVLPEAENLELDEGLARQAAEIPPIVKLVNLVIVEALRTRASDIHIEPTDQEIRIRLRVDGVLRDFLQAPGWLHAGLTTRLKVLSKLDIAEKRVPQDGRFKIHYQGIVTDIRLSTLPTQFGEKAVMRVLGSSEGIPRTDRLGIPAGLLGALSEAVMQPQGMIVVTGPTGSGKTTTLYSLLSKRQSSEVSIVTVEDPIEYHLEGANQVQVNTKAGLTFAGCLRSILRQDPDVILVGEVRDRETAEIAFHAAMTGHLVLTSLHTNSAVATVLRLLDLGIDPFVITSSVTVIVAQRLARLTCDQCRTIYTPPPGLLRRLKWEDPDFAFSHGRGCPSCHGTGFKGRIGIYEVLQMTPAVREAINAKGSEAEIRKAALSSGFVMLVQDARDKLRKGLTTPEELLRVIQLQDEPAASCPKCGRLLPEGTGTCPHCAEPARFFCRECGKGLTLDQKICSRCATPLSREFSPASDPRGGNTESGSRTLREPGKATDPDPVQ